MWSTLNVDWDSHSANYEGIFFKEIDMSDGLVTSSVTDQNFWEEFTLATDVWENFTDSVWNGTVFTEVTFS
tara:strand:- start:391 stop:603 length:213 start_codon:yes stop_codon:yes gene_type:complete